MNKVLILNKLRDYKNFNSEAEFARFLDITPQNLSKWRERNTYKIDILSTKYPEVNTEWLLTGEGEMLKAPKEEENVQIQFTHNSEGVNTIPLLPMSAQGGSLSDFVMSISADDCERIISPIKNMDFAMSVSGESMSPEYPSGSQILIKKINERAFIDWGRVYVLDTCNGSVIKKIMPSNDDGKIKCVSINPEYPPFEVSLDDIYGVYRVMLCMASK